MVALKRQRRRRVKRGHLFFKGSVSAAQRYLRETAPSLELDNPRLEDKRQLRSLTRPWSAASARTGAACTSKAAARAPPRVRVTARSSAWWCPMARRQAKEAQHAQSPGYQALLEVCRELADNEECRWATSPPACGTCVVCRARKAVATADGERFCRVCGCTQHRACDGDYGTCCSWVAADLCSVCLEAGRG